MVVRVMKEVYDSRPSWPGKFTGAEPMNIVVKLTRGRITELREWHDCVKLSCNLGKTLGNPEKCEYLIKLLKQRPE
jgi:nicotinate phosphoribosyltransferase